MSSNSPRKSVFIWKTRNLNSAAKFAQNNVTNPPKGLCKADTEEVQSAAKPPAERIEATKVYIYLYI